MVVAHGNGILHRDLKPSNVLLLLESVSREARPSIRALKIADFSHVRLVDHESSLTQGEPVGTPNYMAPEQVRGEPVDARADVYGLCAILYEMLTGVPPYKGPSAQATMEMVRSPAASYRPESLRPELARSADRDLASICMMGLDKERGRRCVTVDAVLAEACGGPSTAKQRAPGRSGGRSESGDCVVRGPDRGLDVAVAVVLFFLAGCVGGVCSGTRPRKSGTRRRWQDARPKPVKPKLRNCLATWSSPVRRSAGWKSALRGDSIWNACRRSNSTANDCLRNAPQDTRLRIVLTWVLAGLGELMLAQTDQGRPTLISCVPAASGNHWRGAAQRYRDSRFWLATTLLWQARTTASHSHFKRALSIALDAESLWVELNQEQPGDPAHLAKSGARPRTPGPSNGQPHTHQTS